MAKKRSTKKKTTRKKTSSSSLADAPKKATARSRAKQADPNREPGKQGRTKGASTVCTDDLIDFAMHELAQSRRDWMVREAICNWIEDKHPGRALPCRATLNKIIAKARAKKEYYCPDKEDTKELYRRSIDHYIALSADPTCSDLVRLKARQALDRLVGIGAEFATSTIGPEAAAARAIEFMNEVKARRAEESDDE